MSVVTQSDWIKWLLDYPDAHILQTAGWGELKSKFGWKPRYVTSKKGGALILFRNLPLGLRIGYIPKGPVGTDWDGLWPEMDRLCKSEHAFLLKIEPDLWEPYDQRDLISLQQFSGYPSETIQPRRTIIIPLDGSEAEWLSRMKQKTRYNIRLAEKKEVRVDKSQDLAAFSRLMQITGERDGFGVHTGEYYYAAYNLFRQNEDCELFIASFGKKPLAGLMVFKRGRRAWFLFGGSNNEERNRMPTYLIQWEAMRWAASKGCLEYDLWGAPDEEEKVLENEFETRSDGLWSVYRFKRGFGGSLKRSVGALDRVYYPNIYKVYGWMVKKKKSLIP